MIEELKALIAVVNSLPQLALWVAIGFWAYKVIIIGSVYGVIRLAINKAYSAWTNPKRQEMGVAIDGLIYYSDKSRLIGELSRILPADRSWGSAENALAWLSEAITEKITKDGLPKK